MPPLRARPGCCQRLRVGAHDLAHVAGDDVSQDHVCVFLLLDILAGGEDAGVYHVFELAAPGAEQGDGGCVVAFRQQHGIDYVEGIAAGADADHYISWLNHRRQLLGEDMFVGGVVAPGRDQGNVVGKRDGFQARRAWGDSIFRQIEGKVRSGGRAAAVAHNEDAMAVVIGRLQQRKYGIETWARDGAEHLL